MVYFQFLDVVYHIDSFASILKVIESPEIEIILIMVFDSFFNIVIRFNLY